MNRTSLRARAVSAVLAVSLVLGLHAFGWLPVQAATAEPVGLEIRNRTGQLWRGVFVTPSSIDHWGRDLARSTVKTGESLLVPIEGDSCRYDIRVMLSYPGEEQLLMDVDACASLRVTVGPKTGRRITRVD